MVNQCFFVIVVAWEPDFVEAFLKTCNWSCHVCNIFRRKLLLSRWFISPVVSKFQQFCSCFFAVIKCFSSDDCLSHSTESCSEWTKLWGREEFRTIGWICVNWCNGIVTRSWSLVVSVCCALLYFCFTWQLLKIGVTFKSNVRNKTRRPET